jgi:fatty acid desaturase
MEEFVTRADLLPRERMVALSRKTNVQGLAHLALHTIALAVTGALLWQADSTWWVGPAMVVHGIVVAFLFCFHHELIHRTVFTRPLMNDALAVVTGWLVFYPAFYFRLFHYAHHRHTQDREHDPELVVAPPTTRAAYLWWAMSFAYMWRRFGTSFVHAFTGRAKQPFIRDRHVADCVAEARLMWAGYILVIAASVYFEIWVALQYWLGPILLGQPFLRLYLMAEHVGCDSGDDMIANARTTISNPVVRILAWNMPYHTEHHLFPSVPFHALPELHREIKDQLRFVAPGYIAVHRELWPSA